VVATEVPLYAATVRGDKATVFVVDNGVADAHTVAVKGEAAGSLFLDSALVPDSLVVTEGRALLVNGDHVDLKETSVADATVVPLLPTNVGSDAGRALASSQALEVPVTARHRDGSNHRLRPEPAVERERR
jgi:hypothetical protein